MTNTSLHAKTGSDGRFELANLPSGSVEKKHPRVPSDLLRTIWGVKPIRDSGTPVECHPERQLCVVASASSG